MPRGLLPRGARRTHENAALVRDVIADALCGPNGYFATRLPVLASHTALPFREMTRPRRLRARAARALRGARGLPDTGRNLRAVSAKGRGTRWTGSGVAPRRPRPSRKGELALAATRRRCVWPSSASARALMRCTFWTT